MSYYLSRSGILELKLKDLNAREKYRAVIDYRLREKLYRSILRYIRKELIDRVTSVATYFSARRDVNVLEIRPKDSRSRGNAKSEKGNRISAVERGFFPK